MLALFYLLGFISGVFLCVIVWLILRAKKRTLSTDDLGRVFLSILND